jgi:hypothetical protein
VEEVDNISDDDDIEKQMDGQSGGTPKAFTRQIVFNIIGYGILA